MSKFFIILIFATVFIFSITPVKDPDFGWHYRCGKELLAGAPCLTNTFSYFLPDYQSYYWSGIYDVSLSILYDFGGFWILGFVQAILITAVYFIFTKLSQQHDLINLILFSLVLLFSTGTINFGLRPQMFSFLFLFFTYFWSSKIIKIFDDEKTKLLSRTNIYKYAAIPVLMLFWVNTHIGFFTGIVLCGFLVFYTAVKYFFKKYSLAKVFVALAIFATSAFASLINPFGYKVYIEIYRHLQSPLSSMIAEWVPPPALYIGLILIFTGFILTTGIIKKKLNFYDVLILLFFAISAMIARRNTPLFFSISIVYIANLMPKFKIDKSLNILLLPILGAVFIFSSFYKINKFVDFHNNWQSYCTKGAAHYPCETLKKFPDIHGNVYATYEWGGYLIWQRSDFKIFADGRMPAWTDENGKSPYAVYLEILQTQPGWNEKLRKLKTDYLLIPAKTYLGTLLESSAKDYGWKMVYTDGNQSVYKNIQKY